MKKGQSGVRSIALSPVSARPRLWWRCGTVVADEQRMKRRQLDPFLTITSSQLPWLAHLSHTAPVMVVSFVCFLCHEYIWTLSLSVPGGSCGFDAGLTPPRCFRQQGDKTMGKGRSMSLCFLSCRLPFPGPDVNNSQHHPIPIMAPPGTAWDLWRGPRDKLTGNTTFATARPGTSTPMGKKRRNTLGRPVTFKSQSALKSPGSSATT
ncbi:hypothetical protein QBC39DRAFT_361589 [Podospora conica]|nr:hypothetical protein QBC39DRAFT_361589 [Schizothecium conicum]